MNRDSNSYTFIYASGLVILVAALLASAAVLLKPFQDSNIEVAKKSDILKSVGIASDAVTAVDLYRQFVKESYIVNDKGAKVNGEAFDVDLKIELTKDVSERLLPVYVCQLKDGSKKFILPVRGSGLWGPVWGYVALDDDKQTVFGATFGHKGETPGLGAEIASEDFQKQFKGKKILENKKVKFSIVKGGASPDDQYAVDAISGGTITSVGVEAMLLDCLEVYTAFLNN